MAYQKTTLNFGGTFRFLEQPAKGAENRHFQILFFEFPTRVVIGLDVLYPQ
jgi:hypothetical protein